MASEHGQPNIVLAGFMAAGKTSVGRRIAALTGRPFIDMDALLEERLGAPIAEVFARGDEAAFRAAEADLCRALKTPAAAVIAAGGGAVLSAANRAALAGGGLLFCLECSPQEALRRLGSGNERPMLRGDPAGRLPALLAERAAAYAALPRHVDTTGLTVAQAAQQVLALYERDNRLRELPVACDGSAYTITFGEGSLRTLGARAAALGLRSPLAVITNDAVGPLYGEAVQAGLEKAGLHSVLCTVPDGEVYKTLDTVSALYDQVAAAGLERGGAIVALGGGVVGDMAGFVAATYLRGLALVQIPTTVLAMVDSSVGGKVGVDHARGKNLIGAFKQPAAVISDPALLVTLPDVERRSGLAEVIKHGVIGAPEVFAAFEEEGRPDLAGILPAAIQVKIDVVEEDPLERGRRLQLNLGHTFGHALELLSGYRLRHGEAVAIGMAAATRLSARLGLCQPALIDRIEAVLQQAGLPVRYADCEPQAVLAAMSSDKKRQGGRLRFVLPAHIGRVLVTDRASEADVLAVLSEIRSEGREP